MSIFKTATDFITRDLWHKTLEETNRWQHFGYLSLRCIVLTVKGFLNHDINTRANALTYSMMFAVVPILALVLAIAKGFGFEALIEKQLYDSFLGQMNLVPTVMGFVDRYLQTAQGGAFIGVGLLILLWSVYSFFSNIEASFNTIWQMNRTRPITVQVSNYITVMLLMPMLLVVSSGLSIVINGSQSTIFDAMAPLKEFFIRLSPFLTCWLIFSWMYYAIPNTKVGAWAAFIPGILIGTLFQLMQMFTVYLVAFLARTSIVYGVFAAVPLLLTWLQLSCLFILSGAELSFAIQNNEKFEYDHDLRRMSRRYKDYVTLYLIWLIVTRFEKGLPAQTAHEMAQEHNLPARLVNQLLDRLFEIDLVNKSYTKDEHEITYTPCRDIHTLTVGDVIRELDKQGTEQFLPGRPDEQKRFWKQFLELREPKADTDSLLVKDILALSLPESLPEVSTL